MAGMAAWGRGREGVPQRAPASRKRALGAGRVELGLPTASTAAGKPNDGRGGSGRASKFKAADLTR
jgi:hypothetical protein